ncbi:MAG: hypothetical protein F4Z28_02095 [Gammaproteobacteria bacterium]|nr:hypothetical protein [Gammaproteobacteria bacterium]
MASVARSYERTGQLDGLLLDDALHALQFALKRDPSLLSRVAAGMAAKTIERVTYVDVERDTVVCSAMHDARPRRIDGDWGIVVDRCHDKIPIRAHATGEAIRCDVRTRAGKQWFGMYKLTREGNGVR